MSGYNNRNINDVFPFSIVVHDKDEARTLAHALFEAEVSFAVTQDFPYTFRLSEAAKSVTFKALSLDWAGKPTLPSAV